MNYDLFLIAVVAMMGLALFSEHARSIAAACLLLANFIIWSFAILVTPDWFPWWFAALLDALSVTACFLILQPVLAFTFVALVGLHLLAGGGLVSYDMHYLVTATIGWAQLGLVIGMALGEFPKRHARIRARWEARR